LACSTDPCSKEQGELQVPCRVQQAADAAQTGNTAAAQAACKAIAEGPWQEECFFRTAEELGRRGILKAALESCTQTGRFKRFCLTHVVWFLPPETPGTAADWLAQAPASLKEAPELLRARWWFNHYFGTGQAAAPQDIPTEDGPFARGAWALEAVRIAGLGQAPECWKRPCTGAILPPNQRVGRYDPPMPIPGEDILPWIPTFGGSKRLVGETEAEDLQIALLEATWFLPAATGDIFEPYLDASTPRTRYTAFRLFRTLPSRDPVQVLSKFAADPDPIIRSHVQDALLYRTWLGKPPAKKGDLR
jgi:hypothetical protein